MNKEEIINILIEELGLTNYIKVADYLINLETTIIKLQEENEKLKADYGNKAQVERDLLKEENEKLEKQLRTSAIFNEEDIRLDQTKEVFETLENILNTESCSYRYLIYDLLGFKEENYIDLIAGMSITNAIVELEDLKKQNQKYKEVIDKLKEYENNSQLTRSIEGTKIYDGINANYEIKSILKRWNK